MINLLYDGDCPSCMKQAQASETEFRISGTHHASHASRWNSYKSAMDENPEYEGLVALTNLHAPGAVRSGILGGQTSRNVDLDSESSITEV